MTKISFALAVAGTVLITGCATVTRGTRQKVDFVSEPPGATVQVRTGRTPQECVTPCTLEVRRSRGPQPYSAMAAGREPFDGELIPEEADDGASILLAIGSGLLVIPGIIDLASEAFYDWPEQVKLVMPPEGRGASRAIVSRK